MRAIVLDKFGELDSLVYKNVKPARVFGFQEIREAHRVMEANQAGGKMAVVRG